MGIKSDDGLVRIQKDKVRSSVIGIGANKRLVRNLVVAESSIDDLQLFNGQAASSVR